MGLFDLLFEGVALGSRLGPRHAPLKSAYVVDPQFVFIPFRISFLHVIVGLTLSRGRPAPLLDPQHYQAAYQAQRHRDEQKDDGVNRRSRPASRPELPEDDFKCWTICIIFILCINGDVTDCRLQLLPPP